MSEEEKKEFEAEVIAKVTALERRGGSGKT
jgi:hypothetical protein